MTSEVTQSPSPLAGLHSFLGGKQDKYCFLLFWVRTCFLRGCVGYSLSASAGLLSDFLSPFLCPQDAATTGPAWSGQETGRLEEKEGCLYSPAPPPPGLNLVEVSRFLHQKPELLSNGPSL